MNALCIECDAGLDLAADLLAGEIVACPDCSAELEVISSAPLRLDPAPEIEEDWGE